MRPRLLDLFCGGGGAGMGYHRAGFEVTGIDCNPQKRYPFTLVQGDALQYFADHWKEYDVITGSPPCQGYSALKHLVTKKHSRLVYITRALMRATGKPYVIENVLGAPLIEPLMLCGSMFNLQTSCGAQLRRHRLFESNVFMMSPCSCQHGPTTQSVVGHAYRNEAERMRQRTIGVTGTGSAISGARTIGICGHSKDSHRKVITVTGSTPQQNVERNVVRENFSIEEARRAMGIDWMVMKELSQAIPPAYTEWIGRQILEAMR